MQAPSAAGVSVTSSARLADGAPWFELRRASSHVSQKEPEKYFVLLPFFPNNKCLPLRGQVVTSMLSFVLVWKRNRSAEQTEQKRWKTKPLFFRPRSAGKHLHVCKYKGLVSRRAPLASCLPCSLEWPQHLPTEAVWLSVTWRIKVQPMSLSGES